MEQRREITAQDRPMIGEAETAACRAYHVLERMIVTLELPPAGVTTERELIERSGLGRTPVREAIQRLSWEGLMEVRARAGLVVAPLRAADWPLVIEARTGIEIVLARAATRRMSEKDIEGLARAADTMHAAAATSDAVRFLEADKLLDEIVAYAAENPYAARLAAPLQTHSRRFWFRYHGDAGLERSADHHMRLIDAIRDRDETQAAEAAARLMAMLRELAEAAAR